MLALIDFVIVALLVASACLAVRILVADWQNWRQRPLASFPPPLLMHACSCSPALALHARRNGTASRRQLMRALIDSPAIAEDWQCD